MSNDLLVRGKNCALPLLLCMTSSEQSYTMWQGHFTEDFALLLRPANECSS